jgi:uncharacterized protein (TIGR03437 family)
VLFDGVPAPMIYTSAGQLAAIVPYSADGKATVMAQVESNLVKSDPIQAPVAATVPGLFALNASATGAGAILNQDGSVNTPANPARVGSTIVLFGTGEGQTSPPGVDGLIATAALPKPAAPVSVTIGGQDAKVEYEGAAPLEVAGVIQINVDVPLNAITGDAVPVIVKIGNAISQRNLTVSIR